jgi:hypothetical protein
VLANMHMHPLCSLTHNTNVVSLQHILLVAGGIKRYRAVKKLIEEWLARAMRDPLWQATEGLVEGPKPPGKRAWLRAGAGEVGIKAVGGGGGGGGGANFGRGLGDMCAWALRRSCTHALFVGMGSRLCQCWATGVGLLTPVQDLRVHDSTTVLCDGCLLKQPASPISPHALDHLLLAGVRQGQMGPGDQGPTGHDACSHGSSSGGGSRGVCAAGGG